LEILNQYGLWNRFKYLKTCEKAKPNNQWINQWWKWKFRRNIQVFGSMLPKNNNTNDSWSKIYHVVIPDY